MSRFDADSHIDAAAQSVGLKVAPEHREGVKRFLLIAAQMRDLLEEAELDPRECAPAPVYIPPGGEE